MKPIPTKVHGILDYLTGAVLILAPSLFDFSSEGAAGRVPLFLGVSAILYSLLTRYEWSLVKVIPMRVHLGLDFMSGLLLAASPWLFGFADEVWKPHFFLGLFEIGASLMTRSVPADAAHPTTGARHAT